MEPHRLKWTFGKEKYNVLSPVDGIDVCHSRGWSGSPARSWPRRCAPSPSTSDPSCRRAPSTCRWRASCTRSRWAGPRPASSWPTSDAGTGRSTSTTCGAPPPARTTRASGPYTSTSPRRAARCPRTPRATTRRPSTCSTLRRYTTHYTQHYIHKHIPLRTRQ